MDCDELLDYYDCEELDEVSDDVYSTNLKKMENKLKNKKYDTLTRSQKERERVREKAVEMFREVTACDPELSTTMACEAVGRKLRRSRLTIWRIVKEAGLC